MTIPTVHPFLLDLLRARADAAGLPGRTNREGWARIQTDVKHHGLTCLLYRWLTERASENVPAGVLADLKADVYYHAARNVLLARELRSILERLRAQAIPYMTIRGLAFAEQLYGNITSRCIGDIDILVTKESLPRVAATLERLGYREMDRRPGFARAFSYTLEFIKDVHGWITIEPHWTIAYPPFVDRLDMTGVWSRCRRGHVLGTETWELEPTDLLLHLCLHLIHRGVDAPLLWFWEIDQVIRRAAIDWASFLATAHRVGLEPLLARFLFELCRLFETPVPDAVLSDLRRPTADRSGALARLIDQGGAIDGIESFALVFTIAGLRGKLRYLFSLFFPSREFMRLHYAVERRRDLAGRYLRRIAQFVWEGLKGVAVLLKDPPRSAPLR